MPKPPTEVERALDAAIAAAALVSELQSHSSGEAYTALTELRALVEETMRLLHVRARRTRQQRKFRANAAVQEAPRGPIW